MKNALAILLIIIGIGSGIYSYQMPVLTTDQVSENIQNSFSDMIDKSGATDKHHEDVYNPELLNERTNVLIAAGIFAIMGTIILYSDNKQ